MGGLFKLALKALAPLLIAEGAKQAGKLIEKVTAPKKAA